MVNAPPTKLTTTPTNLIASQFMSDIFCLIFLEVNTIYSSKALQIIIYRAER